jgi:hypothetical protein
MKREIEVFEEFVPTPEQRAKCQYCKRGIPRIPSSVSDKFVHMSDVGRVLCEAQEMKPKTPELVNDELLACLEGALLSVRWRVDIYAPGGFNYDPDAHSALCKFAVKCEDAIAKAKAAQAKAGPA